MTAIDSDRAARTGTIREAVGDQARAPHHGGQVPRRVGVYLHVPFCARKCPYCDFNTYAGLDDLHDAFVDAICREIERRAPAAQGRPVDTVFIGGGTPTILRPDHLRTMMAAVRRHFIVDPDAEITSEANPGAVDRDRFAALREAGVNRLSMGAQSFRAQDLKLLGRIHDTDDVCRAVEAARAAGFDNLSLDLMFGLPGQSRSAWAQSLEAALELRPTHLSLYSLIVEPETPLHRWVQEGTVIPADDDDAAAQYEDALARMREAGYVHYEVSNWALSTGDEPDGRGTSGHQQRARPTRACRHNLRYWSNGDWIACGPGAHGHVRFPVGTAAATHGSSRDRTAAQARAEPAKAAPGGHPCATSRVDSSADLASTQARGAGTAAGGYVERRYGNHRPVPGYIRRVREGAPLASEEEWPTAATAMGESMMMGLRLIREGVQRSRFQDLHGQDPVVTFRDTIEQLQSWGLVTVNDEAIRLTRRGLMVGNRVFEHFVQG